MPPREETGLLAKEQSSYLEYKSRPSDFEDIGDITLTLSSSSPFQRRLHRLLRNVAIIISSSLVVVSLRHILQRTEIQSGILVPSGPYRLVEVHEGSTFFDYYDFYEGPDSLGSAGYNVYVSKEDAEHSRIVDVIRDDSGEELVYMSSAATKDGPRNSIRLEGKRRFERGLFLLDVRHMPNGPGVWPAFWLTDEAAWPRNGEVDILEGVNGMTTVKTALHTSNECDMYAHVASYDMTGDWEWITGIPDTFTGQPNFKIVKPADNCWVMAQHQWANEGCTAVHNRNNTIGGPVNDAGGGVYALEWDPQNHYIKSWVFSPREDMPHNLIQAIETAGLTDVSKRVIPDPRSWRLPYAYFAIGETTGCSADHFKNMRIVFNLAFCGNVAGNRFTTECPTEAKQFNVSNDPVKTCEAYIASDPKALKEEAFWKIRGVYVYERELEKKTMMGEDSQQ
eukprot:CCRYP_004136-RA/>CCRYP_004136-RA protein AED:0.10 eAED:0.10 QI:247/1/1/1/0.83/0.71/7/681/450